MVSRKRSTLGMSVLMAMLGLMAVMTAGAQAASLFLVENKTSGAKSAIQVGDVLDASGEEGQLLTGLGIEVECAEAEGTGTIESASTASANITFVGCEVTAGKETCAIGEEEVPAATKVGLDGGKYAKFVPFETALQEAKSEDQPFANVTFKKVEGEECLLIAAGETEETVEVTGEEAGEIVDNTGAGTGEKLVFSQEISDSKTEGKVEGADVSGLFISGGENEAAIDGEIKNITVLRGGNDIGFLVTH